MAYYSEDEGREEALNELRKNLQFLLEYIHAILATTPIAPMDHLTEAETQQIMQCAEQLLLSSMMYARASSLASANGAQRTKRVFGSDAADIEFQAKSNWVLICGKDIMRLRESSIPMC